jgi:hypothetical protein
LEIEKGFIQAEVVRKRGGGGRIFGFEWWKLAVDRRRMHNEKQNDLRKSPNLVWGIKSRGVGWA